MPALRGELLRVTAETHAAKIKWAREEFGFVPGRNPREARQRMIEEQAGLTPLIGEDFRGEFSWAMELLDSAPWQHARSMPENPHEYTLLKKWDPLAEAAFFRVVRFIRSNGALRTFQGWPYLILEGETHFYWSEYWPVPMITLINRKPVAELAEMGR